MTEREREDILDEITDREWEMFREAGAENAELPQNPHVFKLMRHMIHSVHGDDFLHSLLSDLRQAERDGRNLVREKYALMDGIIPLPDDSELAEEIAAAEGKFLDEAKKLYPDIIPHGGTEISRKFMRCELQTLSPRTLELYAREIGQAREDGINLALARHNWLAKKLGKPILPQKTGD